MERNELLSMYYQIRELIRKYSHVSQFITVTDTIEKEYLNQMFDCITWEFPATYLNELLND